jgi:hypothetical protein
MQAAYNKGKKKGLKEANTLTGKQGYFLKCLYRALRSSRPTDGLSV